MPIIHSSPHPRIDPEIDSDIDWNPSDDMPGNAYPDVSPGYDGEAWGQPVQAVGNDWSGGYDVPDRPDRERGRERGRERVHRHRGRRDPEQYEDDGLPELLPQEQPSYGPYPPPYPVHSHSAPQLAGYPPIWPPHVYPYPPPPHAFAQPHSFAQPQVHLPVSQHASRFNPGGDPDVRHGRGHRPFIPGGNAEDILEDERMHHNDGHHRRDSFEDGEVDDWGNVIPPRPRQYIRPEDIEEWVDSSRSGHERRGYWEGDRVDDEYEEEPREVRFAELTPDDLELMTEEEIEQHRRQHHAARNKQGSRRRRPSFSDVPHLERAPQHRRQDGGGGGNDRGMISTAIPQWNGGQAMVKTYKIKKDKRERRTESQPSYTFSYAPDTYGPYGPHDDGNRPAREETEASGLLKAVRWITGYPSNPTLHPLLRTRTLMKPVCLKWDIQVPPEPRHTELSIGQAVAAFSEPAARPRVPYMTLILPIPGIERAQWTIDVIPSPNGRLVTLADNMYTFDGTPTTFSRKLPRSKSENLFEWHHAPYQYGATIRCIDVFDAICTHLQKIAKRGDYETLSPSRRGLVSKAFYRRCHAFMGENGLTHYERGSGNEEMDEMVQTRIRGGLKRIDFMIGKTKWEGLRPCGPNQWTIVLGEW